MKFYYKKKLVTIKIKIFDKMYTFLVDTGSEKSFLSYHKNLNQYTKRLQQKIKVKGIGKDTVIEECYVIPNLIIDGKMISKVIFLKKRKNWLFYYLGIDGIIGWDVLKQINFVIDFKHKLFQVGDTNPSKFLTKTSIISDKQLAVNVSYNSQSFIALFDLGANNSIFSMGVLSLINDACWKNKIILGINGFSIQKTAEVHNVTFVLGDMNFKVDKLLVRNRLSNWAIKFGTDSLLDYKVYFKNSEREVIIVE